MTRKRSPNGTSLKIRYESTVNSNTGIRIGELCALTWNDISFQEKTMHIQRTMQRIQSIDANDTKTKIIITTPKSICSSRFIPIPDCLLSLLDKHKTDTGYILTSTDQFIEPRTMHNHYKNIIKECNISDATFHTLRHTFATRCIEVGFDIKSLSEILGHSNVSITLNRYVHPSMDIKQENMKKFSDLFAVKETGQQ